MSSATNNGEKDRQGSILRLAKRLGALKQGRYKLASGQTAQYYFDGRLITLDPEGAHLVAQALMPILEKSGADTVGGPAIAAVPMVAAIAQLSFLQGHPISGLIVRDEMKKHGTGKIIEGTLLPDSKVAIIDDTCSTGSSLLHAINTIENAGGAVVVVACILDRHMGGSDAIKAKGHEFFSLLEADEDGNIARTELHC